MAGPIRFIASDLPISGPPGRQRRANAEELRDLGAMPTDPATRYAVATMQDRPAAHPPTRLVQQWVPVTGHPRTSQIGLSDLSNRVEIRAHDGTVTAVARLLSDHLRGIDQAATSGVVNAELVDGLAICSGQIPADRVEASAYAIRCDFCGRLTGDRGHDCPAGMPGPECPGHHHRHRT